MKRIAVFLMVGMLCSAIPNANSAPLEGSKCKKANAVTKSGSSSFVCLKSETKLVLVAKFKKCADAISAGRAPILQETDPLLYKANAGLDRDKDGIACDK